MTAVIFALTLIFGMLIIVGYFIFDGLEIRQRKIKKAVAPETKEITPPVFSPAQYKLGSWR